MIRLGAGRARCASALLIVLGVISLAVTTLSAPPAASVVVLDGTWRSEGGRKGREWAGFGAHVRLAAEPQFAAVVALGVDEENWGEASGTWIGNHKDRGYILTAAHVFEPLADPETFLVRSPGGRVHRADRIWVHPDWNGDTETRTGYDLAILRLTEPMTDAGPPPRLYAGDAEAGRLITFVGFGMRGIGSTGEAERFQRGTDKAAAQGVVDDWMAPVVPLPADGDAGNYLGVFLSREDGGVPNPHGGSAIPATPLVGLLGSGDSGGSAWMQHSGNWVLVGVNSNGSGTAAYGDTSWFTRVSPHRAWIAGIVPGAAFTGRP